MNIDLNLKFTDNSTNITKWEIDSKNIMMETVFTPTFTMVMSALGVVVIVASLLAILLSQRLKKQHDGYNPTQPPVIIKL